MKKYWKQTIALLAALLLFIGVAAPALALEDAGMRTVRVGYYRIEGYNVMDEDGARSGYGYEVLQAMKLYNNWTYEYVGYDKGWADIQQMMLDGEVDMVISAVRTPAREEIYDFSDRAVSQSGACLLVKAGESPYVAGKYADYDGMRIGFIENSSQIASTETFAREKGFSFEPVYYKTSDELERAILSGEDVDAIVTSNMRIIAGTRRLELYAMQDVHAMVRKGDSQLLEEINYALEQISLYSPNLYNSLMNKYYSVDTGDEVFYSPEETEFMEQFIQSGSVLRAALVPNMSPYSYYEGGEPRGIMYDIASEILRRTGLPYEVETTESDADYRALVESGAVDLRLATRFDYNNAEKMGFTLIDPYYSTDVSRVTRKGSVTGIKTVAVVRDSIIESCYLPTVIDDETVVAFDSVGECVEALLQGRCDALYMCTRSAQEAVYYDVTNRLTSIVMPQSTIDFTIGVRDDIDARLASILEKASESLSDDDVAALVLKYTDYSTPDTTLLGLLYNNPAMALLLVAITLGLLFAGLMLVFVSRKRAAELRQNLRLQAALSEAEQANKAKSVFMSRMSHEIRTPLNAIIGYNSISCDALSGAKSEPEYRQAAMKAVDCLSKSDVASKHLLTVINDVLDMSAIESGKIKIAHEPFDFKSVIYSLTTMFYSQAKAKGVELEVTLDTPTEEWFVGDEMRINQIITNLLSNAVKFTPAGGTVRLKVSQPQMARSKANIHFEVSDTGIGMSSEFMRELWTPFEQADASISRRFGGTGLGLSITKNLVDLMGGAISAVSEPGAGSTFKVDLTLDRMEQPEEDRSYDFSGINALVADDDPSTCDYLRLLFDRCGVKCTTVTSGSEAIAAVKRGIDSGRRHTLCIVDWQMPGMDGLETVRKIRELAGPDIPIIFISAYDLTLIENSVKTAGANYLVAKPLFQSTVFDILADLSGRPEASARHSDEHADLGGARVLLAEDNRMNMEIAKAILGSWNLTVDQAWNGQEAYDMFCAAPEGTYRAILMDVHMPEVDGYKATEMIRRSGRGDAADVPIVAMTADVFAEDVAEAMAAGMNAHVGKPIEKNVLLEVLRKYCL